MHVILKSTNHNIAFFKASHTQRQSNSKTPGTESTKDFSRKDKLPKPMVENPWK